MPVFSVNVRRMAEWKKFQDRNRDTPKVIYLTDKPKISSFYKVLTAHFRDTIAFAHVFNTDPLCQ